MLKHFTQHEDMTQDIKMTEFSAEFLHTQSSVFIRLFKQTDHFHYNNCQVFSLLQNAFMTMQSRHTIE